MKEIRNKDERTGDSSNKTRVEVEGSIILKTQSYTTHTGFPGY